MKIRTIKDKDYTVMSNYHFKDNGLNSVCTESKATIRNIINELKEFHYLDATEKRRENVKIYYEYMIYEKPFK